MSKDTIEVEGSVIEALRDRFKVELLGTGIIILAHIGGKLRKHNIRIVPGDLVSVALNGYDSTRGIIKRRIS